MAFTVLFLEFCRCQADNLRENAITKYGLICLNVRIPQQSVIRLNIGFELRQFLIEISGVNISASPALFDSLLSLSHNVSQFT